MWWWRHGGLLFMTFLACACRERSAFPSHSPRLQTCQHTSSRFVFFLSFFLRAFFHLPKLVYPQHGSKLRCLIFYVNTNSLLLWMEFLCFLFMTPRSSPWSRNKKKHRETKGRRVKSWKMEFLFFFFGKICRRKNLIEVDWIRSAMFH